MKKYPGVFQDKNGTFYIQPRIKDIFGNTKKTTIRGFTKAKEAFDAKNELQNSSNNKKNVNIEINTKDGVKTCRNQ